MLVICNGAVKSGSTWLYNILEKLVELKRPPDAYLTDNSRKRERNPCIRPDKLAQFMAEVDYRSSDYISKNHLGNPIYRDLLVNAADVYVFGIEREIRDVVVSAYYDECNRNGFKGTFNEYYWHAGRYLADDVIRYHAVWRNAGTRICTISYEGLHSDFANEIVPLVQTLGQSLDAQAIESLREQTSMKKLRQRYQDEPLYEGDKFFRKGVTGDWKNHFDDAMSRDIERIERQGLSAFDRRLLIRKGQQLVQRALTTRS